MSKRWLLLVVLVLLVGCNDAPDEAPVIPDPPAGPAPGETVYTLDQDITWGSDTLISGVWYVAAGVTLRIEAGVEVSLLPGTGLIVDGILDLAGTAEAPVTFVNASTLSVGNFGVSVGGAGDLSNLDNVSFTGVSLYLEGGASASISGSSFADASLSVSSREAPFVVDNCSFSDGQRDWQTAIVARDLVQLDVTSSTFHRVFRGIQFDGIGEASSLNVTDCDFSDLRTAVLSGLGGAPHSVVVDTVRVTDSASSALDFYNAQVTVRDSTVESSLWHGIVADRASMLTLRDSSVTGAMLSCVVAHGGLDAQALSVSDCADNGIWIGDGGGLVRSSSVLDVGGFGIGADGALSVESTTVQNSDRSGIYGRDGDVTLTSVNINSARGYGVQSYNGDISITGSAISSVDESGVYAHYGSVFISDTTVSDARSYGLRSYRGDLVVEAGSVGVEISAVDSHAVYVQGGDLTATGLTVSDVGGIGIYCSGGDLSLTNSTVTASDSHGIYVLQGGASIDVIAGPVIVESAGGRGVLVTGGNLSADGVVVRNSSAAGVDVSDGQLLVSNCAIENAGASGISARQSPSLSVSGCAITGSYDHGITLSSGGNLVVAATTVASSGLNGIYGYRVTVQVTDTVVSSSGGHGIYAYNGALSVSNSSVLGATMFGIYAYLSDLFLSGVTVANTTMHGVYGYLGDADIDQLQVIDQSPGSDQPSTGGIGVAVIGGHATISNTLVDKASSHGFSLDSATVTTSTISNGGASGIVLSSHDASSISNSNITDNVYRGIQTVSFGANLTDIIGNNITGNGERAVVYGQIADGNYIADNFGQVGADTDSGGVLDGVRDTSSSQTYALDVLSNAQSTVIVGTGPAAL